MIRASNVQCCLYKYRSPEIRRTLQAIHRMFGATDLGWPLANTAVITRERIGRAQRPGEKHLQGWDDHIAKTLNDGWEILSGTSHTGDWRTLLPFARRDSITISFRKG